jgi:PPOX class probable F420-dependent enzyme
MDIFQGPVGKRILERLRNEQIIWLTTVTARGKPQPRPVWFIWDGYSIVIYTEQTSWKVAHLAVNPQVSLNFNSDEYGGDIHVLSGEAGIDSSAPLVKDNLPYISKYTEGISAINMDIESFSKRFDIALRVQVNRVRGLDPL